MEDKKGLRRIPLGILATLTTIILASGGAAAWFTWRALNPNPPVADFPTLESPLDPTDAGGGDTTVPTTPSTLAQPPSQPSNPSTQPAEISTQVYWLKDVDGRLSLTAETIPLTAAAGAEAQLQATLQALLAKSGNPQQQAFTTIPEDTQILAASIDSAGIHIDLSSNFQSGGGSASMTGRLGQIIYTATAQDPSAAVWVSVDGKPLTLLGGEGLEVRQPMTRDDFNQDFGF